MQADTLDSFVQSYLYLTNSYFKLNMYDKYLVIYILNMRFFKILLIIIICCFTFWAWLSATPVAREFSLPTVSQWAPTGDRNASLTTSSIIPLPDAFHTMHVSTSNSDEIWTAIAPTFESDWISETDAYIAEGPTFDNAGNLYFTPTTTTEDVSLVSLDRTTGKRRWAIPGKGFGNGAPLILNDPANTGQQIIYHSTYTTAMALRTDGSIIWSVPTNFRTPPDGPPWQIHMWGMNYLPNADALVTVSVGGKVIILDRHTGKSIVTSFQLPGSPAAKKEFRIPKFLSKQANTELLKQFKIDNLFDTIIDVVFGNNVNVANYFAVDPKDDSIIIAATAPDENDGNVDGISNNGAIYRLHLTKENTLEIINHFYFSGGSGATPTISADSKLILISDDTGNVIALDPTLKEVWRINVGTQVLASIAVAADGKEMYVVNRENILKLHNDGNSASIVWKATLDAYPGFDNLNASSVTIAANGILVGIAAGRKLGKAGIMTKFGMGLLDRETGKLRWYSEGREETVAISSVGPDGAIYIAHSPMRRALSRGILGDRLPPLIGGIQKYKPTRYDLLARDAICAANKLATRHNASKDVLSRRDDALQINILINQAKQAGLNSTKDASLLSLFDLASKQTNPIEIERQTNELCLRYPN